MPHRNLLLLKKPTSRRQEMPSRNRPLESELFDTTLNNDPASVHLGGISLIFNFLNAYFDNVEGELHVYYLGYFDVLL